MIVQLLLPLLAASTVPADSAVAGPVAPEALVASAVFADPPVRIDMNERVYEPGDRARVRVETDDDGYLLVLHVDVNGNLRVLYPLDPFDDSYVRGDRRIQLDGRGGRETFIVEADEGQGWIYAAHSRLPFQVERYAIGDHWDYARLAPSRLPESPEPELTELVRGMARASFDYDVIPYTVARDRRVATRVVHTYDPFWYDCFGCGYYGPYYRSGITIHIGSRYGRCWDAFWCDPYYYDPYYYRPRPRFYGPVFYHRAYYYPRYYYYRPHPRYRPDGYAGIPYRPGFGDGVPYRDRRTDGRPGVRLVSDNTVYGPPPRRAAGIFDETPVRRTLTEAPGYDTGPVVVPSRRTDDAGAARPTTPDRSRTDDAPRRRDEPAAGSATPQRPEARPTRRTGEPGRSGEAPRRPSEGIERTPDRIEARPATPTEERPAATPSRRDAPEQIEARPSRPEAPARSESPSRGESPRRSEGRADDSRSDDGPRSSDRDEGSARSRGPSSSAPTAQPAPRAPERRPAPQVRSGDSGRSGGSAPARSGGSSGSSGGGRRRGG